MERQAPLDEFLLSWVEAIVGLTASEAAAAIDKVAQLGIGRVNQILFGRPDVDSVVAAYQLATSIEKLISVGVPKSKLISKLRNDPDFWPTWAEVRAAGQIVECTSFGIVMEADRKSGSHADYRVDLGGGKTAPIEFKALGLSDEEVAFCKAMAPKLRQLLPSYGLLSLHTAIDNTGFHVGRTKRLRMWESARHVAAEHGQFPAGLSGVRVAASGGEENYVRRLVRRLVGESSTQLSKRGGWAAFLWTNSAPATLVLKTLTQTDIPTAVQGLILIGDAVMFPVPGLQCFVDIHPRETWCSREPATLRSRTHDLMANDLRTRMESSSGLAAVLMTGYRSGKRKVLMQRDGSARVPPFGLYMDIDPSHEFLHDSRLSPIEFDSTGDGRSLSEVLNQTFQT